MSASRTSALIGIVSVAGVLSGTPAVLFADQGVPGGGRSLKRHQSVPAITEGKLPASDPSAIARRWGIEIECMRLASSGYMLEFRYKILDANKAQPLFGRGLSPRLHDEASAFESTVPNPPTTGALRSTYDAKAGRTYFMFFANPSQFVKAGSKVTVTIGDFRVTGVTVTADAAPSASAAEENGRP